MFEVVLNTVGAVYEAVNQLGACPSPSGRGRRDSHAKREPVRAKPEAIADAPGEGHKSVQILRPSPYPLPKGEGEFPRFQFIHTFIDHTCSCSIRIFQQPAGNDAAIYNRRARR